MNYLKFSPLALHLCFALWVSSDPVTVKINGAGWVDLGRIMHVSDSTVNDGTIFNSPKHLNSTGNVLFSPGVQIGLTADLSDNLTGELGFGTYRATHSMVSVDGSLYPKFITISLFKNYISKANLSWYSGEKKSSKIKITLGDFSSNYNPDVKNLGMYLLRGPVYPGLLMGGFKDFSIDTTKSNVLGAQVEMVTGPVTHDLILLNEWELPPTFDWSLAYIAKANLSNAFQIGAGINFYRLLPNDSRLETPGKFDKRSFTVVDTITKDTVFYSNQGTKLMVMFSLGLNEWFHINSLGNNDLKLYGEAAVLGVKNYGTYYDDIFKRIPVTIGFNFPVFGYVDFLSLEVEWYGSMYRNDLANIGNLNAVADWTTQTRPIPSPIPVNEIYSDSTADNWKWSILLEKTVHSHIKFSGLIANDHYRPRPAALGLIASSGGTAEAFSSPKDWYFMMRMGYSF